MYLRILPRYTLLQHAKVILFQQLCHPVHPSKVILQRIASLSQLRKSSTYNNPIRLYSSDGDSILEPELFEDHNYEESTLNFSFKKILYLEDDPKMKALNACSSVQNLLEMYTKEDMTYESKHLVQIVILLWDFCRKAETSDHRMIIRHQAFQEILRRLQASVNGLNSNESTCCYLYLRRIGLDFNHKFMQELLLHILDIINKDKNIPLSALSRFSVAVSTNKDFNSPLICCDMMPHLFKSLQTCTTGEELRLITICLSHIRQLVSAEILDTYKEKVKELISLEKLNIESTKCILKVLNFLNHPSWSYRNSSITRQLMVLLLPIVDDLFENEVKAVFKIFQSQLEPAALSLKLLKVSEELLQKYPTPEMLACVVQFVEPKKRENLSDMCRKLICDESMWKQTNAASHFFIILRSLKISDTSLCDEYWKRVLKEIDTNPEGKEYYVFSKHFHRYMFFNNNLGGTYRHIEFEKRLTQLCMNEITNGMSGIVPSKFANIASFVIGYGHTYRGNVRLPNIIITKMQSMVNQFSIVDCLQLSRGIQIALEMRFRHFIPTMWTSHLATIENVLNICSQRHIENLNQHDVNDLNAIVRALNNRKAPKKSDIYQQALNKYNDIKSNTLSSRVLRSMSFNLSASHFVAPEILETMFDYIVKHETYVTGDTAEKILSCSYNLGYSPQVQEGLDSSAKIVMRDFDYMSGLSIIQACLALCFYKTIPEQLINKVFCVDFIKRIEEEIEMCYSKATYPERVLNHVMQLNRAVCLDFPEADVPWFQQNYLEAQLSKYPFVENRYSNEVKQVLLAVLKDESLFRCNHVTPYGYRIDFVIHFDKQMQQITAPVETTVLDKITKVAILLLKLDSMCENDLSTLRGKEALRMRHLEMLGYKVVHINESDWNDMKVKDAKASYLKCLLQITS